MDILRSIAMSFSMFSKLPAPMVEWKKENMKYMLAMLPLVGAVIGGFLWLWWLICDKCFFDAFIRAAGYTVIPVFISGGIHLDGFCDTVDALSSHALPEKKRQILKDPNAGAFAIIYTCVYFFIYYVLCLEISGTLKAVMALLAFQMLSRVLASLSGIFIKAGEKNGLLSTFSEASSGTAFIILLVFAAGAFGILFWVSPWTVLISALMLLLNYLYVLYLANRQFEGMSGDLAGYINQLAQITLLAGLFIAERFLI
ncbi:MAG: adenosylcobinamide-GDP ribazoletransferase [Lachnospiraceae bacterium]|nr:adenosylcobinamide-GDP ribazoletransferase [Lachnospiraceae bacterium]